MAERTKPAVGAAETLPANLSPAPAGNSPTAAEKVPAAAEKTAEKVPAAAESPAAPAQPDGGGVLIARKGPAISVETVGPRRITVGRESTYEVGITNSGEAAGEELTVFVSLPEWAEVVGAEASSGAAQVNVTGQVAGTVQWKLGHLDAKGHERLTLKIIPRQSRAFDLAVRWETKPVATQATIEVQEAKFVLQLEGPREVLYGKKEGYRLKLINVGNGNAENVAIMLMPIGGGENVPATHKIGALAAGAKKCSMSN